MDAYGKVTSDAHFHECISNLCQLPPGVSSSVKAPTAGCGEKARQQAVVWLAQDVYAALLGDDEPTLRSQLKLVTMWRDIVGSLNDDEGVAKIHDLLIDALGQEGPMLLS